MRVIAKSTLKAFYENPLFQESKQSLEAWYKEVTKAQWKNPNEIKAHYAHASILGNNRVVFNIHGNTYRLIVKINYEAQVVYVRFVGTHKAYDAINALEI